jgi:hypothetical protein
MEGLDVRDTNTAININRYIGSIVKMYALEKLNLKNIGYEKLAVKE